MSRKHLPRASSDLKQTLSRLDFQPRKSRGQNFLANDTLADEIVEFAELKAGDKVIEIGPGLGVLTKRLLAEGCEVLAFEVEQKLATYLTKEVFSEGNGRVVVTDIRDVSLSEYGSKGKWVVVGNIPYSISSDVILWTFENREWIEKASFLFQREFAERVAAAPGGSSYGTLSIIRSLFASSRLGSIIEGDEFVPPAKVQSRLLQLVLDIRSPLERGREEEFIQFVRACFTGKRKTLLNALSGSVLFTSKALAATCLEQSDIDSKRRAETLSLEEFLQLYKVYTKADSGLQKAES